MERITSKDNRGVKRYVRLAASKRERDGEGRFVFEGVKLCRDAFESGAPLEQIFVTPDCLARHAEALAPLLDSAGECFEIAEPIAAKLSDQKTPQGVFAVAPKLDKTLAQATIYEGGRYLFLVGLQDSGNVGTILRTAEAFGVNGVILTRDTCDPFAPKTVRGSMGAVFRLPLLVVPDAGELLGQLAAHGVATAASVLDSDAISLHEARFPEPAVLLIGNEGNGLPAGIAQACSTRVTIPMRGRAESLNASMAAGILLWEMLRDGKEPSR